MTSENTTKPKANRCLKAESYLNEYPKRIKPLSKFSNYRRVGRS